jgi:uncharacterized protein
VFLHGSGPSVRAEYAIFAKSFARIGFAGLIFDKRGSGKSGGSWINSSLEDLAGDAVSAIAFLKKRPDIDPKAIGIWAISQSGWVVPLIPSNNEIAFEIIVTGGGATPYDTEMYGYRNEWEHAGLSDAEKLEAEQLLQLYFNYLRTGNGRERLIAQMNSAKDKKWYSTMMLDRILPSEDNRKNWSWVATFDPLPYIRKMKMPVLLLFGDHDLQTPTQLAIQRWKQGLLEARNKNFQVKVFPNAAHGIRLGFHHGAPQAETDFAPGYFESMQEWLKKIVASSAN